MESYYNTTNLIGRELNAEKRKTITQEDFLLTIFNTRLYEMTSSQAHFFFPPPIPLTSVRRAMTNLVIRGFIEKTKKKQKGIYGKPEYIYRLVELTKTVTFEKDGQIIMGL